MMRGIKSGFEERHLPRPTASAALVACALLVAGSVKPCLAAPSSQTTFPSPDDASRAGLRQLALSGAMLATAPVQWVPDLDRPSLGQASRWPRAALDRHQ